MGKPLISSESATWLNEHFLSSWGDVKKVVDLFFLGGVNHIFYHGVNYSPKEEKFPGWLFYAAVHFNQQNPQWKDFHALNTYITRVQSFLQQGRPDNDVLVFYPLVDRYQDPGKNLLQHFDNMEHEFDGTDFQKLSEWMLGNGYAFDFFSDRQLQNITFAGNRLNTGGNSYQTILLPANKYISEKSFQKLIDLATAGATILVYKNLPEDVPGFHNLADRRSLFQSLRGRLKFNATGNLQTAVLGKGKFIISGDVGTLLTTANIRKELLPKGLHFVRRKNADGQTYLVNNRSDTAFNGWITISAKPSSVALFDAMFGSTGLARWKTENGKTSVYLQLKPFESVLVQTYATNKVGTPFRYIEQVSKTENLHGKWSLEFLSGGPTLPAKTDLDEIRLWTDLPGENTKDFSGTAKYAISFEKPKTSAAAYLLDLGKVHETAEVFLNGKKVATLIGPGFNVVIPAQDFNPTNRLEIFVSNLMANRIAYMDRNNMPWKKFYNINMSARRPENLKNGIFDASEWKPLPSGLAGPISLTPVR